MQSCDVNALVTVEHLFAERCYVAVKDKKEQTLTVSCPACGAKPGEKCELSTGLPRTDPYRDRRLAASEK